MPKILGLSILIKKFIKTPSVKEPAIYLDSQEWNLFKFHSWSVNPFKAIFLLLSWDLLTSITYWRPAGHIELHTQDLHMWWYYSFSEIISLKWNCILDQQGLAEIILTVSHQYDSAGSNHINISHYWLCVHQMCVDPSCKLSANVFQSCPPPSNSKWIYPESSNLYSSLHIW